MSTIYQRGCAEIEANLTPMIDVTFLLIVFFVLVSQLVEVEHVALDLPMPEDPATIAAGEENRAVINVIPQGTRAAGYRLGGVEIPAGPEGIALLTDRLAALIAGDPTITVNLRADRNTQFEWLEPVLHAVSDAATRVGGAPRLNLVVQRES